MVFFQRLYFYYLQFVKALVYLPAYPFLYYLLQKPERYRRAHKLRRYVCKAFMLLAGIRIERIGPMPEKGRTFVIVANHTSELDILQLLSQLPLYFGFMAKQELSGNLLLRIFFKTIDIEVDRERGEASATAYRQAMRSLQQGKSIVIFAEGGIFGDPRVVKPFKEGAFQLAIRQQLPILPISLPDNWKVMPDEKKTASPGKIRLILHEAVETIGLTSADVEALKEKVHRIIAQDIE